ncbi:unnamed protein product [Acanthoscelides obtectus]|uniref:Uncharacterized protein n=1 Tax=Acanthoscelides obtectus TaxID=200917 RepID=A0A9P0Q770_ACAOB|nr:unnamed protein product [Acanthoscelides obtectus]CAK1674081.1 hypothetical protein AOBTE_LOCUS29527 [Acanthoscelides obtectus]
MSCFILRNVAKYLNDEDFAVDLPGDGEQEEIHNQHAADVREVNLEEMQYQELLQIMSI